MLICARPHRPLTLSLLILLLEACGGSSGSGSTAGPTSEDLVAANTSYLQSTFDAATNRVTLQWLPQFADTNRYRIERQDATGSWVVIDEVWGSAEGVFTNELSWTGGISVPATLRVVAVLPDYIVPLGTQGAPEGTRPATSITVALPAPLPSITVDQPEPLESPANVSLVNAGTYVGVIYIIDQLNAGSAGFSGQAQPPGYSVTLNPDTYTTGTHLIYAELQLSPASTVTISKSVSIHSSKAAIESISTALNPGVLDAYVLATSDSGIASVVGNLDQVPFDTLAAPNACLPMPCAAGQSFNAYHLSINTQSLVPQTYHAFTAVATDNAGNTASTPDSVFTFQNLARATLVSPTDGAVVSATLHLAGTFSSTAPGALELMITLDGQPIYDTTVANTGAEVPYSTDVSLAGVAPGPHTLTAYARVGNADYTRGTSMVIQVTPSP
jgi:hypothetical protein